MLHTEMHCAAGRHPQDIELESVEAMKKGEIEIISHLDPVIAKLEAE